MGIFDGLTNLFGSDVITFTGQKDNLTVKTDYITGSAALNAHQGTTINGSNISIVLATGDKSNLYLPLGDSNVITKTNQYIEKNPYADNHADVFRDNLTQAINQSISDKAGKTFIDDRNISRTYNDISKNDKVYNDLANAIDAAGDQQLKKDLTITSETSAAIKGTDYSKVTDGVTRTVNPYENFYNMDPTKRHTYQQTIGGSDLTVFYMAEYPNIEDVLDGIPSEAQRKDLVIFELDSALSISYSILRERFPARTIGRVNPKAYTRGSRTIAGHIAFAVFTEDVLTRLRSQIADKFNSIQRKFDKFAEGGGNDQVAKRAYSDAVDFARQRYYYQAAFEYNSVQLLDSLPNFHLLVMGVNESGTWAKFIVKNVSIIDENQYQGTQQPNIVNKVSWVAQDIIPMASFKTKGYTVTDSLSSVAENYHNGKLTLTSTYNQLSGSDILDSVKSDLSKSQIN